MLVLKSAKMSAFKTGTCLEMCPLEEFKMREKQRLLHVLEMVPGTEKTSFPRASKERMVKCFSRSAAGKHIRSSSLRPPEVLLQTVKYLLYDVVPTKNLQFHKVYDFITDRLMAVRQDMVVQNMSDAENIAILQPIVRFHAYSAYRLCTADIANFDPSLNNNHLQECLKKLLRAFDTYNHLAGISYFTESRPEFEAMYLLFNLGSEEALGRAFSIPQSCKTKVVRDATTISLCFKFGNFVRVCRLIRELPDLLAAVASLHLPLLRQKAFEIMSTAYNSRNLTFPKPVLTKTLLYGSDSNLEEDCQHYGIKTDETGVHFMKQTFTSIKPIGAKHELFVEKRGMDEKIESIFCM